MTVMLCMALMGCVQLLEFDDNTDTVVGIGNFDVQSNDVITRARAGYEDFNAATHLTSESVFFGAVQKVGENDFLFSRSSYVDGVWKSNMRVRKYEDDVNVLHNTFGLIANSSLLDEVSISMSMNGGVPTMTIQNLPVVCNSNILVSSGAARADATLNKYSYSAHMAKEQPEYHKMNFIMDNMMCGVGLSFKIDDRYSRLRSITVKEVKIGKSGTVDGKTTAVSTMTTATIGFGQSALSINYATPAAGGINTSVYSASDLALELSTTAKPVDSKCYIVPGIVTPNDLVMTVKYDVYDKKGNLIRENQTATNKLTKALSDNSSNSLIKANNMINLLVTVAPTYLYSLGDDDLDNPGITIINLE